MPGRHLAIQAHLCLSVSANLPAKPFLACSPHPRPPGSISPLQQQQGRNLSCLLRTLVDQGIRPGTLETLPTRNEEGSPDSSLGGCGEHCPEP